MKKIILLLPMLSLMGGCAGFGESYKKAVAEREASEARRLEQKCLSLGFKTEDGVRSCMMNIYSQQRLENGLRTSCIVDGGVYLSNGQCLK